MYIYIYIYIYMYVYVYVDLQLHYPSSGYSAILQDTLFCLQDYMITHSTATLPLFRVQCHSSG